jgi:DNA polymerase-3 subunit epsilon
VEATGLDTVRDRIIEFGVSILNPNGEITQWMQQFNPGIPIPASATEIHGITDSEVRDAPSFAEHARGILSGLSGKDLGGYNLLAFDLPIIDEELRRCGLKLDITGVRVIDCCAIFKKKAPRTLEAAVKTYCGRDHEGAHGAGADARATLDVFLGQLKAHEDLDLMTLPELATFSQAEDVRYVDLACKLYRDADGDICYAFGKNKDRKVKSDYSYAEWMLRSEFPGSTKDALKEILQGVRR